MDDVELEDATDLKRDLEAVIDKYPRLDVYTILGALQVVNANLLERLGRL